MNISLRQLIELLCNSYAIFTQHGDLVTRELRPIRHRSNHEFMSVRWGEDEIHETTFFEGDNETVECRGPMFTLMDYLNQKHVFVVVVEQNIEEFFAESSDSEV
jgi:hypothetical protein